MLTLTAELLCGDLETKKHTEISRPDKIRQDSNHNNRAVDELALNVNFAVVRKSVP